jgi:predicted glycoside hydrolase/deacetylase ChbG (UPF0249 family)
MREWDHERGGWSMVVCGSRKGLIVNVDDFGISSGVNRAVVEAHLADVVTSASLMVNVAEVEEAVALSNAHSGLSIGLHVNFTNEGDPVVDLADSLACEVELNSQLARFLELTGKPPTHIDSHHHVHRRRDLQPLFSDAARRLGVPLRDDGTVEFFGSFYAAWDGEIHAEQVTVDSLTTMLASLDAEVTELSTHVGHFDPAFTSEYHRERELELATIMDPRVPAIIRDLGFDLVSYAALDGWRAGNDEAGTK